MDKISRENLVQNLNLVNSRIKEAKKKKFEYKTDERYLTGWAIISQIEDYKELVEVLAYLKSQMANTAGAAEVLTFPSLMRKISQQFLHCVVIL